MMEYFKNRPFLCVSFSFVPSSTANTRECGWMNKPGALQTLNKVVIVDRVTNKIQVNSSVIIDIINATVVKNDTSITDNEVMSKYISEYKADIQVALKRWAAMELEIRGETLT